MSRPYFSEGRTATTAADSEQQLNDAGGDPAFSEQLAAKSTQRNRKITLAEAAGSKPPLSPQHQHRVSLLDEDGDGEEEEVENFNELPSSHSSKPPSSLVEAFCMPSSGNNEATATNDGDKDSMIPTHHHRHTSTLFIGRSKSPPPPPPSPPSIKAVIPKSSGAMDRYESSSAAKASNRYTPTQPCTDAAASESTAGARRRRAANRHKRVQQQQQQKLTSDPSANLTNGNSNPLLLGLKKSALGSPGKCGFVGRKTAMKGENRMSSSTSNDSSCSDDGVTQVAKNSAGGEKKRSNSDKDESSEKGTRRRNRRHRARKHYNQQAQHHQSKSAGVAPAASAENHHHRAPTTENIKVHSHRQHRRAVEIKALLGKEDKHHKHQNTDSKMSNEPWARNLYIVKTQGTQPDDDKYSTLPADFSPMSYHQASSTTAADTGGRTPRTSSMINDGAAAVTKPTRVRKFKHETSDMRKNSAVANIIKHLPAAKTTTSLSPSNSRKTAADISSSTEKHLISSSGRKAANFDRSIINLHSNKSVQIESLRSFFDKPNEQEPRRFEFGQLKASSRDKLDKAETVPRPKLVKCDTVPNLLVKDTTTTSSSFIKHSQTTADLENNVTTATAARPLVKAKKIGEHYWPRDEDTEKLLGKSNTSVADQLTSSQHPRVTAAAAAGSEIEIKVLEVHDDDNSHSKRHTAEQDVLPNEKGGGGPGYTDDDDAGKKHGVLVTNDQHPSHASLATSGSMPSQASSTETLTSDSRELLRNASTNSSSSPRPLVNNCKVLPPTTSSKPSQKQQKERKASVAVAPSRVGLQQVESQQKEAIQAIEAAAAVMSTHSRNYLSNANPEETNERVPFDAINKQLSLPPPSEQLVEGSSSSNEKNSSTDDFVSSQRKNSVVSLSQALPTRKSAAPDYQQVSSVEIDEGVYEIDDVINDLNNQKVETEPRFASESYYSDSDQKEKANNNNQQGNVSMQGDLIGSKLQCADNNGRNARLKTSEASENASFNSDNLNNSPFSSTINSDKWLESTQEDHQGEDYVSDLSINTENNSYTEEMTREEICKIPNYRRGANIKLSGKPSKKKSYSDPNATAVRTAGLIEKEESDALQRPNSCSEPILKEQADKLTELDNYRNYQSSKVQAPRKSGFQFDFDNFQNLTIQGKPLNSKVDENLGDYLDQRKHSVVSNETISPFPSEMLQKEEEQFKQMYDMLTSSSVSTREPTTTSQPVVHTRSCSAPVERQDFAIVQQVAEKGRRFGIIQAPSLDELQKDEGQMGNKKPLSTSADQLHSATLPRNKKDFREDFGFEELDRLDLRKHVVKNLLETESSYVNSLRILYQSYLKPLKRPENHVVCEPKLVDEIFFQIPEILQHHEKFFENVRECFENWDTDTVKMGDLFIQSFNKDMLLETYTSYIKNYLNAREAITVAVQAKTAFKTFLENCQRENKEKQGLSDLLIKPVQRIPRYELIIKDLLKHTPETHPDHKGLIVAQEELHALSVQMNKGEKEAVAAEAQARQLQDIESLVEGCLGISGIVKRKLVRQDMCTELKSTNKKDRSLWLFNDTLMCTTSKKGRTGTMRRSSLNLWAPADQLNFDSNGKYKFLWKFPLEDVELLKGSQLVSKQTNEKQMQIIRSDQELLSDLEKTAEKLHIPHQAVEDAIKDLQNLCQQRLNEKRVAMQEILVPGRLEIGISTPDGMKSFQFEFASDEGKGAFETSFRNFKETLTQQKNRFDPTFMKAIPISKTRNGMQFSCATANTDTSPSSHEVWVCNTDGYVGQICFLALEPEPSQTQCITVCNAKICCITQVPTWDRKLVSTQVLLKEISKLPLGHTRDRHKSSNNRAHQIISWDDTDDTDEENTSPMSTMSSRSPYSTNNSISCDAAFTTQTTNTATSDLMESSPQLITSLLGGGAFKKESNGSTLHGSLEDLLGDNSLADCSKILANQGSMWLGTEDGKIKVYSTQESVRGNKHCVELQNTASVQCILYHAGQVFIALSNGDLLIYHRDATNGQWDFDRKRTIQLGTSPYPITKMLVVNEKELWCGCQNQIRILDVRSHNIKSFFTVSQDSKRCIQCMASFGFGVWVAMDKKPQIKLYHSVTHSLLADLDVSNAVNKMLASSDAIIRQHKAACLRITALLVCKDLLWVGTSGGVVLTLVLPNVASNTTSLPLPIIPQGLAYGHTGHVRFLTAVRLPDKDVQRNSSKRSPSKRKHSSTASTPTPHRQIGTTLVISGGDGYEDFGISSSTETAGREDSTNHLLMWKV